MLPRRIRFKKFQTSDRHLSIPRKPNDIIIAKKGTPLKSEQEYGSINKSLNSIKTKVFSTNQSVNTHSTNVPHFKHYNLFPIKSPYHSNQLSVRNIESNDSEITKSTTFAKEPTFSLYYKNSRRTKPHDFPETLLSLSTANKHRILTKRKVYHDNPKENISELIISNSNTQNKLRNFVTTRLQKEYYCSKLKNSRNCSVSSNNSHSKSVNNQLSRTGERTSTKYTSTPIKLRPIRASLQKKCDISQYLHKMGTIEEECDAYNDNIYEKLSVSKNESLQLYPALAVKQRIRFCVIELVYIMDRDVEL